jgi:hypothetical protein
MGTDDGLVHREVMELRATPAQVREFILTPERILDYYPAPVEGGVFEAGRSIWCRGEMGVSMLELLDDESNDDCVTVLVTTAIGLEPPYTPEGIVAATTFTMVEDWALAATPDGTTLTKSWRDVRATGEPPFPLEDAVREAAKGESGTLVEQWNEAAAAAAAGGR